jgi:NADPH:quinone reductase-like Zn-dependent oxidoreductase
MRGYRIDEHGGADALQWHDDLPDPAPGAHEVRVAVRACALNHLDLWLRNGVPGHTFPLPLIPGSEVTGTVDAVGAGVKDLEPGAAVLVAPGVSCGHCERCLSGQDPLCREYGILGEHRDGGMAELIVVPWRNVLPLPEGLSFTEAAAIPLVFLTAWHMLIARAELRRGEDVLIHAAGSGVSSAGLQIARLFGARHIIATAGSEAKLQRALELGATHAVNYKEEDFAARVREITARKGVEIVFDHVGGSVFEASFRALAWGGRVVLCGATSAGQATINLRAVFFKTLSILGSTMGSLAELKHMMPFFERGELAPVIDRVLPFTAAREGLQALENREQFGKLVLEWQDAE